MPNIYKTFQQTDLDNKAVYSTTSTENQKIQNIVDDFITLFKARHLSYIICFLFMDIPLI